MALRDPVSVYSTANNIEAQFVCQALNEAGVEAYVMGAGSLVEGSSEFHRPQIWVDRADTLRAQPVLDDYERRAAELRAAESGEATRDEPAIEEVCEECGQFSAFAATQQGSVQECQHCGAYLDVGSDDSEEEPLGGDDEEAPTE